MLSIQLKIKSPGAKTFLQVIWGVQETETRVYPPLANIEGNLFRKAQARVFQSTIGLILD